jgi:2',3'-cyclic-nucleotide 2'-phosphodiesterase (5'-nucleotidase family)
MSFKVRFLCINDVYRVEQFSIVNSLVKSHSISGPGVVTKLVLPGDFLGGSSFALKHEGESIIDVLNNIQLDYVTIGYANCFT